MTTPETENVSPKSSIATFSLVIGILSVLASFFLASIPGIGVLGGLVALILGIMALREIKAQGFQGRGSAIWGIVLGSISIAWFLLVVFVLGPAIKDVFDTINESLP